MTTSDQGLFDSEAIGKQQMAVNSDGVNPTQECKRKKTRCAFVRLLSDVISLVLCFSFLGLFLYRDGSDIVYRYRGDSLTFCIYTRMRCP